MLLPQTLIEIRDNVFSKCAKLKFIYIEDHCKTNILFADISPHTQIGPPPNAFLGCARVWEKRNLRKLIIPDCVERIGDYWFYGCELESAVISASVKSIGTAAFRNCA